jgi:hypothetical protein
VGLEYMDSAELLVFMAGNQFMVMPDLMDGFRKLNPGVKRIFYETLPPGFASPGGRGEGSGTEEDYLCGLSCDCLITPQAILLPAAPAGSEE